MSRIRLFDLQRQYASIREEIREAIDAVLERAVFLKGIETEAFEREFAAYCGAARCVAVSSGTTALELLFRVYEIGPGDEVILPADTFIATAFAVSNAGATPVLVDVDARTANLDPRLVEAAITPRTKAIVPVHLYGKIAAMDELCAIASAHDLLVLEDAAQAHGASLGGRRAGTFGHAAVFSFFPGKNLGAYGDAGAIVTGDARIADRLEIVRDLGQSARYVHDLKGTNGRVDEIQAAILRVKLRHLDEWTKARRELAQAYRRAFAGTAVEMPAEDARDETSVYHLFVVELDGRDAVCAALDREGIDWAVNYAIPIHRQRAYPELAHLEGTLPVTERRCERILSLPMFAGLTADEVGRVAETVAQALVPIAR